MDNRKRFNELLNRCAKPTAVYNALTALAEPSVQQADDVRQKRQVIVGEVLAFLDKSECVQQTI